MADFIEIRPNELTDNPFELIGKDWALVTAKNGDGCNTMTASWGGVGIMWNKPVAFTFIRPQRFTFGLMENENYYTLSFFDESYRKQLQFCGTKSGTYVYVNGEEVGYGEDSKSLHRYNITKYLKPGENDLRLKIFRYTSASYLEDQDFWRISGIERDVYLSSEKADTGFDFSVISTLDEDLQTGIFKLEEGKIRS